GQRVVKQAARDADGVDPLDLGPVSLSRIAKPRRGRVEQRHVGPRASTTRLWNPPPARITRARAPPDLDVQVTAERIHTDRPTCLEGLLHCRREHELRRHRRGLIVNWCAPPVARKAEIPRAA